MVEPLPKKEEVQDGDVEIHCCITPGERFPGVFGSHRGLPPCPHPRETPKILEVLLWRSTLPVQGHALRPFGCSSGIHQAPGGAGGLPAVSGGRPTSLSRRCPDSVSIPTSIPDGPAIDLEHPAQDGFPGQFGEKPYPAHANSHSPGVTIGYGSLSCLPLGRPAGSPVQSPVAGLHLTHSSPPKSDGAPGADGLLPRHHPLVQISSPATSDPSAAICRPDRTQVQVHGQTVPKVPSEFDVVAGPGQDCSGNQPHHANETHHHHRRLPHRLGRSHGYRPSSGHLVGSRDTNEHKQVGAQGHSSCPPELPKEIGECSRVDQDRQCHRQGSYKSTGGDTLFDPHERDQPALSVGGAQAGFPTGGTSGGGVQHRRRLVKQTAGGRRGMASSSRGLQSVGEAVGDATAGSLCHPGECPGSRLLHQDSDARGKGDRCPSGSLASGPALRIPSSKDPTSVPQTGAQGGGGGDPSSPILAQASVVPGRSASAGGLRTETPISVGSVISGSHMPSTSRAVPLDSLEVERQSFRRMGFSADVIDTLLASRKPSTIRVYNATWRRFRTWCLERGVSPLRCKSKDVLSFLQDGLKLGLSTSTLKRQVAALRSTLSNTKGGASLSSPLVSRFLKGVGHKNPPQVHRFPSWDLHMVLLALTKQPFEPLSSISLLQLTQKTLLLVALTSARRVSELGALSVNPNLCIWHTDRVVFHLDPSFIPKVDSWFHRAQDIVVPSFCPDPKARLEQDWHNLDVRRVLKHYVDRTKSFRKTDCLFVKFEGVSRGLRPSRATLSRWMSGAIAAAYLSLGKVPPAGITAHSVRSAATSAAFQGFASLESICKAATWSTPSTFTKHYKIDQAASAEAAFGRRVLQKVVTP